jgi:hypothetical protein
LDQSICLYHELSPINRAKFDRATFWYDMGSRQWNTSMSASFAALVSAIESLTERGERHRYKCPICCEGTEHEVPGPTRRFKDFLSTYAAGVGLAKQRDEMYSLRSVLLHGSDLMQLDQDYAFGIAADAGVMSELQLQWELWGLTRVALRNWLFRVR